MKKGPTAQERFSVFPGFEHINRYWDPVHQCQAAKILPGEFYVTRHNEGISTVLGSCVSACIYDLTAGIGGMNHFMLPAHGRSANMVSQEARYGNWAMEHLINEILKHGGLRRRLQVKIFGGGRVLQSMENSDVGQRNIEFVQEYIDQEGLTLLSEDVGDVYPRKVLFFPQSGKVRMKKLRSMHNNTLIERERSYMDSIATDEQVSGDIELF